MIIVKLNPWEPINGLIHESTTWEISSNIGFTNILDSVSASIIMLNDFTSTIDLPTNVAYYTRAKRHFTDGSSSDWTDIKPIISKSFMSNIVTSKNIVIDKPIVYIDKASLDLTSNMLILNTTSFKGMYTDHISTSWIVTDGNGTVCFKSIEDSDNLTSISIDKYFYNLMEQNELVIFAIHKGVNSIESPIGKTSISIGTFNYRIISNTKRVLPYNDFIINIEKIDILAPTNIIGIALINPITNETVQEITITTDDTTFTIPGDALSPYTEYYLDIYSIGNNGAYNYKRRLIKTLGNYNSESDETNYEYDKVYESYASGGDGTALNVPLNYSTSELLDGTILLPKRNGTRLYKSRYDRVNQVLVIGSMLSGIQLRYGADGASNPISTNYNINALIKMFDNNYCLIDNEITVSGVVYPIFTVYKYQPNKDSYVISKAFPYRSDEFRALGYTNNFAQETSDSILYIPYGSNKLKRLNYVTGVLSVVDTTPLIPDGVNLIFKLNTDSYMLLGSKSARTYYYQPSTGTYSDGFVVPLAFRDKHLKANRLINGDVVISIAEPIDINDTYHGVLYFNKEKNQMSVIETTTLVDEWYPDIHISLKTGEVLLVKTNDSNSKYAMIQ